MSNGTDWESALITSILDEKNIRSVIKHKITHEFFFEPLTREAFKWLISWYKNPLYGDTPSWEVFASAFEGFEPIRVDDSIIAICDQVRQQKLYSDIAAAMQEIAQVTAGDALAGFDLMRQLTAQLSSSHRVDDASDIRNRVEELKEEYLRMKETPDGLKGKPYPWDALNHATLGAQGGQLIIFYGRPKTGKTWLALETVKTWHAFGDRPLILSQELSTLEICRRFVALSTNVNYGLYQRGQLPPDDEFEFMQNLEAFVEQPPIIVNQLSSVGEQCLIDLAALIDEYGATSVLIDGAHTLGRDWKEISIITKGAKRVANQKGIPILMTTHQNKSRGKNSSEATQEQADDMAHSDAFFQDADLCLRWTADIEDKRARQVKGFTAAIREGTSTMFSVNMFLCENLTQKEVIHYGDSTTDEEQEVDQSQLESDDSSVMTPEPEIAAEG
jgi:replicative DNA helicase